MISKVTKHFPLPRDYREEREEKVKEGRRDGAKGQS